MSANVSRKCSDSDSICLSYNEELATSNYSEDVLQNMNTQRDSGRARQPDRYRFYSLCIGYNN